MTLAAVWNTQTPLESPLPSRVTNPLAIVIVLEQYTPGIRVLPEISGLDSIFVQETAAAALYAIMTSAVHWIARKEFNSIVPTSTSLFPVIEVPGATPTEPVVTIVSGPLKATDAPA